MMKKLPYARRQEILELLKQQDYANVSQLSKRFDVSYMTIRRDIEKLEQSGEVSRIYGGVKKADQTEREESAPPLRVLADLTIEERFKVEMKSKQAIAKKAASFVKEGEIIGMDSSTTTLHMCSYLSKLHITVVTNSMSVALQFSGSTTVNVVVVGGILRKPALTLLGTHVHEMLQHFNLDKCFLSATALSFQDGLCDLSMEEPAAKRSLIGRSRETYVLVDATKVGKSAPFVACNHSRMTAIITDPWEGMSDQQRVCLEQYKAAGVKVYS